MVVATHITNKGLVVKNLFTNHYEKNQANRRTGKRYEQAFQKKKKHENPLNI